MYACESGNETCAAALLENGASVSVSVSVLMFYSVDIYFLLFTNVRCYVQHVCYHESVKALQWNV